MKTAFLIRQTQGAEGTFGKFFTPEQGFHCGELPWEDMDGNGFGDNNTSRINPGEYIVEWVDSPSRGHKIYQLKDVPRRTAVQIHSGNFCGSLKKGFKSDVLGCIILGNRKEREGDPLGHGQMMVCDSKSAVSKFEAEMAGESFKLVITEEFQNV